jgi:hypothetical protein
MLCCGLAAASVAVLAVARRQPAPGRSGFPGGLTLATAALAALLGSALLAQHLGHYLGRAQANDRTLLAEIMAQPICSGTPAARMATLPPGVGTQ